MEHCSSCHGIADLHRGAAPDLNNLLGRKAGAGDFIYSPALATSDRIWTPDLLEQFLVAPQDMFPGNQMVFYGMPDAATRTDLISYVAAHSPGHVSP